MTDQMITSSTDTSLRLWLRLLTCTHMIEGEIRSQLRESFDTTLPRFDVMAQLYRYRDGLRMGEISQLLMVTGGNVTGIIDQLEQDGLVERSPDPNDRRAYLVQLTAKGQRTFSEIAANHRGWIDDLMDGLTPEEQEATQALLKKLRDSLEKKLNKNDN